MGVITVFEKQNAFIVVVLFAVLVSLSIGCASAVDTYTVCPSGCDYTRIQAAINAANPDDTILVHSGTYHENVNVSTQLTIKSKNGSSSTIVVASDPDDHVFEVTADYVTIRGFTVSGAIDGETQKAGIYSYRTDHCLIADNNVSNNDYGIFLNNSNSTTVTNNTANANNNKGIYLHSSNKNALKDNTASDNYYYGISMDVSSYNTLTNNTMSENECNFGIWGWGLSDYIQNISMSNTVGGKPVYYWINQQNKQIPDDAGYVGVVNSTKITVKDLTVTNNGQGVLFAYTGNSVIENVTVLDNDKGIYLEGSSNNTLANNIVSKNVYGISLISSSNNNVTHNRASNNDKGIYLYSSSNNLFTTNSISVNSIAGIRLEYSSNSNLIYHNNLLNNTPNAYDDCANNSWNESYPIGGNYWSDHACTCNPSNGSQPYTIGPNGTDHYPFQDPDGWIAIAGPPNITAWYPVVDVVSTAAGYPETFTVVANQTVNVTWYINGSVAHTNRSVSAYTNATYKNTSAEVGHWNVSAIVENVNGSDMHTWMWNVHVPEPGTIEVEPAKATLNVTETCEFAATAYDHYGSSIAGVVIRWTITNKSVGTVYPGSSTTDANGTATTTFKALTAGTTTIGAGNLTADGWVLNNASVTVTELLPDVYITPADLHLSPSYPLTGRSVVITASVHNRGDANATDVTVDFYVNTRPIGRRIIPLIARSETKNASISWTAGAVDAHELLVTIDENNVIKELNEGNNHAKKSIMVTKPHAISLFAYPKTIKANGTDNATIVALVTDTFGTWVNGTRVNFSTTLGTINRTTAATNRSGIATTTLTPSTSAGTAIITGNTTVDNVFLEDTARVVFEKIAVAETNETITNVTIFTFTNTTVTIRDGNITINTTKEYAPKIARNATKGSMIPVGIKNGTLEVTLRAHAAHENITVTGAISHIKLNTPAESYRTSKPEVGTAETDLDVNFTGIFTPANVSLNVTLRDDLDDAADFVSADATTIEDTLLAALGLAPTTTNRSAVRKNTAILARACLSGTYVDNNVTGVPIRITVNKAWFDTAAGGNVSTIRVVKINDSGGLESAMAPEKAVIDGTNVTFSVTFNRFSIFALIAQRAAPPDGYAAYASRGGRRLIANPGINIFNVEWLGLDIMEVHVDLKRMEFDARVTLKKVTKPVEIPVPQGLVYDYYEIATSIKSDNIKSAAVTFRVRKSWCENHDIHLETITLCRYAAEGWEELETAKIEEDDHYFYFSAKKQGPGLSLFVITGEKKAEFPTPTPTATPTPTPTATPTPAPTATPTPPVDNDGVVIRWIIILAVIVALTVFVIVFSYLSRRR